MQLPLSIRRFGESFIIRDSAGTSICSIYFENEPGMRNSTKRMSEDEAREMAKRIARLLTKTGNTP